MRKLLQQFKKIVFFDAETTGLDPEKDQIIELAAALVTENGIELKIDAFCKLPEGKKIPEKIVELTHITDDMLADKGIDYREACRLLNIAGLGPIFGAMQGALWGPVVFLWITFGTIFAGGVHDYFSGMLSERNNGASISEVCGIYLHILILLHKLYTFVYIFKFLIIRKYYAFNHCNTTLV